MDDIDSHAPHTECLPEQAHEVKSVRVQSQQEGYSLPPQYQSATTRAVSMVTEDTTSFKGNSGHCGEMMDSRQDTSGSDNIRLEKRSPLSVDVTDHTASHLLPSGKVKVKNKTVSGCWNNRNKRVNKEQWLARCKKPTNYVMASSAEKET